MPAEIEFPEDGVYKIIQDHTREAGVRTLERQIATVCRKVATKVAANGTEENGLTEINNDAIKEFLGKARYHFEAALRTEKAGVATGLSVTLAGGDVLFIEATYMKGKSNLILTGQLGDVMKESAQIALSYVLHLHVPAGAIPKDGPSAGITIVTALVSLLTDRPVKSEVAMTGEISLQGQVLPIGGLKQKVLAAHRTGLKVVIFPSRNEADIDDIPEDIREDLQLVMVERIEEVLEIALSN